MCQFDFSMFKRLIHTINSVKYFVILKTLHKVSSVCIVSQRRFFVLQDRDNPQIGDSADNSCQLNDTTSFSREKIKTPVHVKTLFSLQTHLRTYVNLYSFESSMKWPLSSSEFEAKYHFCVNSYHTSAKVKSIPWHFSFIVINLSKIEQNQNYLSQRFQLKKVNITQGNFLVNKIHNCCLKAESWMGTPFLNYSYQLSMCIYLMVFHTQNQNTV